MDLLKKFIDYSGLSVVVDWIKETFVQKENGKGLSSNDYTIEEKNKLKNLKNYTDATEVESGLLSPANLSKLNSVQEGAEINTIEQIKRNGTLLNPTDKVVDIKIPITTSELTNDSGYLNNTQVQQLISDARYMKKTIVETLPDTGEENTLYLVGIDGTGSNVYEEHMYINGKWELIGSTETEVDLSGYVKSADIQIATTEEIDLLLVN